MFLSSCPLSIIKKAKLIQLKMLTLIYEYIDECFANKARTPHLLKQNCYIWYQIKYILVTYRKKKQIKGIGPFIQELKQPIL